MWSTKCLLYNKSKRVIDKQGVKSNFTRYVRQYHKEEYENWLSQSNKIDSPSQINKITNHFPRKSCSPNRESYDSNHPRQIELSLAIVNDLIITLSLPLSIVERPAFINFMRKVDSKFTIVNRRTITLKTIPNLYDEMHDHLITFCSTAKFLSLTLDVWTDRRMRPFFAIIVTENAFQNIAIPGFEKYFVENNDDEINEDENYFDTNDDGALSDEYEYLPDHLSTTNLSTTSDATSEDLIRESKI